MASGEKIVVEMKDDYGTAEKGPSLGPIVSGAWLGSIRRLYSLIMAGFLPNPGLVTYQEWEAWRARPGCRPRRLVENIALQESFERREEELHRQLMRDLFGDGWEVQLRQQRLARERWEEVQLDESAEEGIPGGRRLLGGLCPGSGVLMREEKDLGAVGVRQEKSVPRSADARGPAE